MLNQSESCVQENTNSIMSAYQSPVVQSIVSLPSSLTGQLVKFRTKHTDILVEKIRKAFLTHFVFNGKNGVFEILTFEMSAK